MVIRKLTVPFDVFYTTQDVERYLREQVQQDANEFTAISEFRVLNDNPIISQTAPVMIYRVEYTLTKTEPVVGQVYSGTVHTVVDHGAHVKVPFNIFVRTVGHAVGIGDTVQVKLLGAKRVPTGYPCVGQLVAAQ